MVEEQKPGPEPRPERRPDDDAWIEKVVGVAGALGFNQMRVRWKLIRWQESRRKARRWREQRMTHIRYEHKTCSECGAVQDRAEAVCTRCGAKLTGRGIQVLQRIGLSMPKALSMSTVLALALLGVYFRVWIAAGGGLGSAPGWLFVEFGGHVPQLSAREPWRLVTAIFLHAGLWHLGFNLLAIATIGPRIEEVYGRFTMLMVFVVTATLANVGSELMGLYGVGVGASGGVMGLIGATAGYGQRLGTSGGRALRNDMLKWSAYTFVFGFWIQADNWAHAFGLVTGAAFGYAVRPSLWRRHPRMPAVRTVGNLIGALVAVGALAIILTRSPVLLPPEAPFGFDDEGEDGELGPGVGRLNAVCGHYDRGDLAGALQATGAAVQYRLDPAAIASMCDALHDMRVRCVDSLDRRSGSNAADPDVRDAQRARRLCERAGLSALPGRPPAPRTEP